MLYFWADINTIFIHRQYDVYELLSKSRVGNEVNLVNQGAWNDKPCTIQAITKTILAAQENR